MTTEILLMIDKIETIKGKTRRILKSDIEMLQTSLVALSNDRKAVVADHVERVAESLQRLLDSLDVEWHLDIS
jgi:hypothetical protein